MNKGGQVIGENHKWRSLSMFLPSIADLRKKNSLFYQLHFAWLPLVDLFNGGDAQNVIMFFRHGHSH